MPKATTNKTTSKSKVTAKKSPSPNTELIVGVESAANTDISAEHKVSEPMRAKDVDLQQYITVINGFNGKLVYQSSRTGEVFIWDEFGAEQEIELKELRDAKNSHKNMFIYNWFMFNDEFEWVIDYLGLRQYYKNAVSIEEMDNIFDKNPNEIKVEIANMSEGQKSSLSFRAREKVIDGSIDSRKVIDALEESLNVELIEK